MTVDAGGTGRAITIDGSASPGTVAPVIQCLTVTGGDANGLGGDPEGFDAGGGIYSVDAAPIIANSVITGNYGCNVCSTTYGRGGGIYLLRAPASSSIHDNVIAHNVADESTWGGGGGVMLRDSDAQVADNVIEWNRAGHSAGDGGGIQVRNGAPTISGNVLTQNVGGRAVRGLGGGIYVLSSETVTVTGNTLTYNKAITGTGAAGFPSAGGGIYVSGNPTMTATIRDNVIDTNGASLLTPQLGIGGGLYLGGVITGSEVSGNTVVRNVGGFNVAGNGGGIYAINSTVVVTGNTVVDNAATWAGSHGEGGGIYRGTPRR